jgi:hypothetical protein
MSFQTSDAPRAFSLSTGSDWQGGDEADRDLKGKPTFFVQVTELQVVVKTLARS